MKSIAKKFSDINHDVPTSSSPKANPIASITTEHELVASAAVGGMQAFEAIMRRYNRLLFRVARSIIKNDEEAKETLQDAYLCAWLTLTSFRTDIRLSAWLVHVVVNEALARLRHERTDIILVKPFIAKRFCDNPRVFADHHTTRQENHAPRTQLCGLVEACIDDLPDSLRTIFILRAVEKMESLEVALALSIPEATVRARFHCAHEILLEGFTSPIDTTLPDIYSFDIARCEHTIASVHAKALAISKVPASMPRANVDCLRKPSV